MSQIESDQCPVPVFYFNNEYWYNVVGPSAQENLLSIALAFTLYGVFLLLCSASIFSLIQRSNKRARISTLVLSLTLLALFSSTTVYVVTNFLNVKCNILSAIAFEGFNVWTSPQLQAYGVIDDAWSGFDDPGRFATHAGTWTLTVNILLGDAIVCWRAYVIWQGNRLVMVVSVMLLLATFALGTMDAIYSSSSGVGSWQPDPHAKGSGSLYQGFSYGVAAIALSLGTNLFATVAVAFKAWRSRRTLKLYLVMGPMASQVEKLFSLLVESGAIYCALWTVVLAWQVGTYVRQLGDRLTKLNPYGFWYIFDVIMNGAFVPLIAIYPTVIIVLIALNRSHVENGFMKSSQITLGPEAVRPLTVDVNATVITARDGQPGEETETVLIIAKREFPYVDASEGSSTHTAEERKLEEMT